MTEQLATVARVNAALKAAGHAERLTRGRGYYYFRDGDAPLWPASSVYVYSVGELSVARWLEERAELAEASKRAGFTS